MEQDKRVPLWQKYALTIQEAAEYFHIGEKKLRVMIDNNQEAQYLFMNGSKVLIKRQRFEEFLDNVTSI